MDIDKFVITPEMIENNRLYNLGKGGARLVVPFGANLSGANLSGADLSGADLSGANLSGANLRSANLRSADLSGADLSGANLRSANLRSADLSGANLRSANLRSADLPTLQLFETYCEKVVPQLLNAGGKRDLLWHAETWDQCHSWRKEGEFACPMAEAFGISSVEEAPELYHSLIKEFVQYYDAGLLKKELVFKDKV